ncbi:Yip1 domain-containing protein [Zopfochytrium polystomum]|nr:Yip1 domain-containing protein [Zopfochytrium polystomum]
MAYGGVATADYEADLAAGAVPMPSVAGNSASAAAAAAARRNIEDTLDEPVLETVLRDLRSIRDKLKMVLLPNPNKSVLRDWDLWGPLLLCLTLSIRLSITAPSSQASTVFTTIFVIIWCGSIVVTYNSKFLGGKLSVFQSVCVLGYCIFPLVLASIASLFLPSIILRAIFVAAAIGWSIVASLGFLSDVNLGNRRALAVYPMCLFYFVIGWMILISKSLFG